MRAQSRRSKTISEQDNNEAKKPFRAYGRKAKISDRVITRVRSTDGRDFCSGVYASYTKSRSADPRPPYTPPKVDLMFYRILEEFHTI